MAWRACRSIPDADRRRVADGGPYGALPGKEDGHLVRQDDDGIVRFYGFARSGQVADLVAYVGLARDAMFDAEDAC